MYLNNDYTVKLPTQRVNGTANWTLVYDTGFEIRYQDSETNFKFFTFFDYFPG